VADGKREPIGMEWCDDLILGVDEIDNQHRAIFDHFKRLALACLDDMSKTDILKLQDDLEQRVQTHIETEDRYMIENYYPETDGLRKERQEFACNVAELRHRVETEGPSSMLAALVIEQMVKWVIRHILGHNLEMIAYVMSRWDGKGRAEVG
jgi:hemerythrin